MTDRAHRALLIFLCLFAVGLTYYGLGAIYHLGVAHADAVGSGSASAIAPATTFHDPAVDPGGWLTDLATFAHTSWPIALGLGMFGLLELLALLGKDVPALAALGKGRLSIAIGGMTAVLSAVLHAAIAGGSMQIVLLTAVTALAAWWHPAGTDPAKS